MSYHTQGEIIYWRYLNFEPVSAEELGKEFARISTYTLDDEKETNSYAGYRDWYISKYNRPGYTFETGMGQNPLPISQFEKIYKDNVGVLVCRKYAIIYVEVYRYRRKADNYWQKTYES